MTFFRTNPHIKIALVMSVLFISSILSDVKANQKLTVLVPNFPPYTKESNRKVSGIGIELANKVFKQAKIEVEYHILPNYAKALYELKQGRGDILLLASQNAERDNIAVFSKPLMINRWCWYLLQDSKLTPYDKSFKEQAKISTHFKANTHKWLVSKSYIVEPTMNIDKLPTMLMKKRIDAVFLAELVFEEAVKNDKLNLTQFKKYIEIEKPFGMYISKKYLTEFPETLRNINDAITRAP